MSRRAFHGVIPALAVPFRDDYKIDEDGLARFSRWLARCRGVTAVMTNGHTGEVGSGNVIKLTNNMISLGSSVLIQEALAVGVKAGERARRTSSARVGFIGVTVAKRRRRPRGERV